MSGTHLNNPENVGERMKILKLREEGVSIAKIARLVDRDSETVAKFLAETSSTLLEAKEIYAAAQADLARSNVQHGIKDPQIGMEIADRTKALPKIRDAAPTGVRLNVLIGGAVSGPGNLVPTQETIVAIQAEQKALAEGEPEG